MSNVRASLLSTCVVCSLASMYLFACSDDSGSDGATTGGSGGSAGTINIGTGGSGNSAAAAGAGNQGPYVLPAGFTATEFGGYKLGDPFSGDTPPSSADGGSNSSPNGCGSTILAVVRDFKGANEAGGHADFETFDGNQPTTGMVPPDLGADLKPGYTGICEAANAGNGTLCPEGQQSTTQANFLQWYNYAADVNKPYVIYLSLEPNGDVITFQSDFFFPLDDTGWGNSGQAEDGQQHNFHFTTEVHTEFKYNGGEEFTFIGDDDVWVFINKKLATDVDLGGLHSEETGSISLDDRATELGITRGNAYSLDLFHAERHTNASHFRVDTNLQFTNCGTIVPEIPK